MDEIYEAYFTLLDKFGEQLDRLSELAKRENIAAKRADVLTVNECMKEEQTISLTLRRMDQQRLKVLAALGLQNVPLSELASRCPPAQRQAARAAAESLIRKRELYRAAADASRSTLECALHNVEKLIEANAPGGMVGQRTRSGVFTDFRT